MSDIDKNNDIKNGSSVHHSEGVDLASSSVGLVRDAQAKIVSGKKVCDLLQSAAVSRPGNHLYTADIHLGRSELHQNFGRGGTALMITITGGFYGVSQLYLAPAKDELSPRVYPMDPVFRLQQGDGDGFESPVWATKGIVALRTTGNPQDGAVEVKKDPLLDREIVLLLNKMGFLSSANDNEEALYFDLQKCGGRR